MTILSRPNVFEQYVMQRDFNFGAYLREIRLRNPFTEEIKRTYWTLFTMNVGILIIFVQLIDELQKKYGFEYLGFCGRDTYYLWLLYKKFKEHLGEEPPDNDYLHYSRKIVHSSKFGLTEYFTSKISNKTSLMIDVLGTGMHLHKMRCEMKANYSILLCCHDEDARREYPNASDYPDSWILAEINDEILRTLNRNFCFLNYDGLRLKLNDLAEHLNRATHNSPIRLNTLRVGDKIVPEVIFSEVNDTENFDVLEMCLKEVLNSKIVWGGVKNQNVLENLKLMLNILNALGQPVVMKSRHEINESMDRIDFISGFEKRYSVDENNSIKE